MRSHECLGLPKPRTISRGAGLLLLALLGLVMLPGCEEERQVDSKSGSKTAKKGDQPAPRKNEFIVGKRTQDIKNANAELQKGNVNQAETKITAKDPITLQGNAYVSIIGQTSILQIQHAIDLYHAANDRYPKDHEEFMAEIIKANNIALPQLPYYQAYGYDEKEHKLVILEYPDRKAEPLPRE